MNRLLSVGVRSLLRAILALSCVLICCCSSFAASYEVTTPFVGVKHYHLTTTSPRLLDVNVVEIDPTAPGIEFLVTPSNGSSAGETFSQTTRSFVNQYQTQIGINGSFFASASGGNLNVEGLSASRGDVYSGFEANRFVAMNISADNLATIINSTTGSGSAHSPSVSLYNAVGGNEQIVANGVNVAGDLALHPRTAAGVTAEGKILLMTVDGRLPGHSLGVQTPELAELMLRFGALNAINLDGGGSTTMVFADPVARLVNTPSGGERAVGNNLGVYANAQTSPTGSRFVFSDFNRDDSGVFGWPLAQSSSTYGILGDSAVTLDGMQGVGESGAQRLSIRDDPTVNSSPENPDGWFVRHLAGSPGAASPGENDANDLRPATGVVGLWAKTATAGIDVSIALDDANNQSAGRGVPLAIIADRQWRRYEWYFDDAQQWEAWGQGSGLPTTGNFTIDSIQLFGGNADAVVFIDDVYQETMPVIRRLEWDGTASTDWNNPANWNRNGVPGDAPGLQTAVFNQLASPSPLVTTHKPRELNRIEFNSTNGYLLTGRGSIRLLADESGPTAILPEIFVEQGNHEIELPVELFDDAAVRVASGSVAFKKSINLHGYTITSSGSVVVEHDVLGNGAIVNNGTLTLSAGASVAADLSSFGVLQVVVQPASLPIFIDGDLMLRGMLDVSLVAEPVGDEIILLTATGMVDVIEFQLSAEDAIDWTLIVAGSSLALKQRIPADFNRDGTVDGDDLMRWKSAFGVNGDADADGDGDSDGADFLAWQRNVSPAAARHSSSNVSASVPEPQSVLLLGIAIAYLARYRKLR